MHAPLAVTLTAAKLGLAAAITAAVLAPSHAHAATPPARPHTACVEEDSSWCVWQATGIGHSGNGRGDSFWAGHGPEGRSRVHYITARQAHCLLTHRHSACGTVR